MAATCMAVCKGSRKKIRGIFISSCHLPVAVECDIVILSEPGPIPQAPVGQFCRHNLSPRGDGNTPLLCCPTLFYPDTTYPREGTETPAAAGALVGGIRHNLSPRGDGNLRRIGRSSRVPRHNLSPRGDGNRKVFRFFSKMAMRHNLSPRGDGNCFIDSLIAAIMPGHNLSPRGDGNLLLLLLFCLCCRT